MKLPRPRVSEKVIQAQVVTLLRSVGSAVYVLGTTRKRGDWQGTMMAPGVPDVIAFTPRRIYGDLALLMIEVKAERGRLSEAQRAFRDCCLRANVAYVTGGVNEVVAYLMSVGTLKPEQVAHYRTKGAARNGTRHLA